MSAIPSQAPFILPVKFFRPRLGGHILARERLLARLDDNPERPFTLICAPAGYGKTTLAVQWLQSSPTVVPDAEQPAQPANSVWLSLDEGDNNISRLLAHLVSAIQTVHPEACSDSLALLHAQGTLSQEHLTTVLIRELCQLPGPRLVLVLDDYHVIRQKEIHVLLVELIRNLPSHLHLVLISRMEPPIALARLRVGGLVTEIRARDLRFTLDETRRFFSKVLALKLPSAQIEQLTLLCEGWVAGLQTALLSLREGTDLDSLLRDFQGGRHRIMEYLEEEVFSHQPLHIQEFLLCTSVVDRFTAALADELLDTGALGPRQKTAGSSSTGMSTEILGYLERENLFLVPLDEQKKWYRYHSLFHGLLREWLAVRAGRDGIAQLQARAGRWFESQGLLEEAFSHALAADVALAARLVEEHVHELLNLEDHRTLEGWLARLPEELMAQQPRLLLAQAFLSHVAARYAAMPPLLDRAERLLEENPDRFTPAVEAEIRAGVAGMRSAASYFAALQPEYTLAQADIALGILAGLPRRFLWHQGIVMIFWTGAQQMLGRGAQALEQLYALLEGHSGPSDAYMLRLWMSVCFLQQIDLNMPGLVGSATLMLHHATYPRRDLSQGWAHYFLAFAAYERNDLEVALANFQAASELRYRVHHFLMRDSLLGQALVWMARNQVEEAQQCIDSALQYVHETHILQSLSAIRGVQARLAPATNKPFMLSEMDLPHVARFHHLVSTFMELPQLTYARLLLAEGSAAGLCQADELLSSLVEGATHYHHARQMITALALHALVLKAQNRVADAFDKLEGMLGQAQGRGLIRTFVDLGPGMEALLRQLQPVSAHQSYIATLLAAFRPALVATPPVTQAPNTVQPALIEPLTAREIEVFELLIRRRSYDEIAAQLVISPNTVKKHVSNIYGKLGVERRSQAIAKARQLGLMAGYSD